MTPMRSMIPKTLGLTILLAALFASAPAFADDYADVTALMRSGRHAEALARADQYLAGKPRDPQMRFLKGVVQTEAGRTDDAIATYSRLIEEFPELPEPYNNLAVLYAGQAQFDKARAALEMAIRTNPGYGTAHENLGDVYARLASQAYGRALQIDAGNTTVRPKLALTRELLALSAPKHGAAPQAPAASAPAAAASAPRAPASVPRANTSGARPALPPAAVAMLAAASAPARGTAPARAAAAASAPAAQPPR